MTDEREERPEFEPTDYVPTMNRLTMVAGLLKDEPIPEMLNYVERAHSLGPILDPTAYRSGMQNLDDARDLLVALFEVQKVVNRLRKRASGVD